MQAPCRIGTREEGFSLSNFLIILRTSTTSVNMIVILTEESVIITTPFTIR